MLTDKECVGGRGVDESAGVDCAAEGRRHRWKAGVGGGGWVKWWEFEVVRATLKMYEKSWRRYNECLKSKCLEKKIN